MNHRSLTNAREARPRTLRRGSLSAAQKLSFNEQCYAALKKVPRGKVTTYAALAAYLGSRACRAVGNAMHRNPNAPIVPCHRVVRSDGSIGGYAGGPDKKERMLRREGVPVRDGRVCDLEKHLFRFS